MLKSREHYELIDSFDREFRHLRTDKEEKPLWEKGYVYANGSVNELFLAYRKGYALGKSVERLTTPED
jgi:hypothetical protein